MIKKILIISFVLIIGSFRLFAQPNLVLSNHEVEFEDNFDRLLNIFLINTGNQTVVIDTMTYNTDFYTVRFDKQAGFPLNINRGDTVKMDLLLSGYYFVTSADTTDTLIISGNLESQTVKTNRIIEVKIDVYDDDHPNGIIKGVVKEGETPLRDAFVLFFYDGIYNIREVKTDSVGKYSAFLPRGEYIVAAAKDSFYVSFYDQKFDPLEAHKIELESDSTRTINFRLTRMDSTGNSVGGFVIDANTNSKVRSGIVIVRRGRHTPSKVSYSINNVDSLPKGVYSSFVRPDGTFLVDNILQQDYYFVQSFSNYFLPSYYSSSQGGNIFWQQSDSVFVKGPIQNIKISMLRDSAFGIGSVSGKIILPTNSAANFSDIIVYAKSPFDNAIYNYSYVDSLGNYKTTNLPQGIYKMIAQNIGSDDAESQVITINTTNVFATGINISFNITSVENNNVIPNNFELFQNYPNPFNPTTNIRFSIPNSVATNNAKAVLIIYDLLGRKIAVLVNEVKSAGTYEVKFNARNLASSVYFYRLTVGDFSAVKKLILLK